MQLDPVSPTTAILIVERIVKREVLVMEIGRAAREVAAFLAEHQAVFTLLGRRQMNDFDLAKED